MQALFWLLQAVPYVLAFLLAVLIIVILQVGSRRFGFGLGLIAVTAWLDTATQSAPIFQAGVVLYVADVPFILIGLIAAWRWVAARDFPWRQPGWALYVGVFLFNLAWGLATQGTSAGVQARGDYYAIASASYLMSFPVGAREVRLVVRAFLLLGAGLLALVTYRWVVYYTPITELLPPGGVYNIDGAIRVVSSASALLLAQCLLMGVYFGGLSGAAVGLRLLAPIFLAYVVALQHRSVWLASLVGVVVSMLLARAGNLRLWQQVAAVITLGALVVGGVTFSGSLGEGVANSAGQAVSGQGTVAARFDNWRVTLTDWKNDGLKAVVLGKGYGGDVSRIVNSGGRQTRITFGAHNNYVSQLVAVGLVGFAAQLWALASTVGGLVTVMRRRDDDASAATLLLVLLAVQAAYYIAYAVEFTQSVLLGVAMSLAALGRSAQASSQVEQRPASLRV
ncbi:MAG: hypothetical protein EKK52_01920 [Burkholderiales bacterium]|uniref:O-antigen ligase family protein n=1 Tax=Roseateles sp. TaxID=1971397 RepID=UPI000F91DAB3|nr:MAG: hypothetical protein EKK52_01920 [Burkholderiales bacterium]